MLRFLMLMVLQFGKTKGFRKFIAKYGKKSFDKIQNKLGPNTKFSAKTVKKVVTKSKPVKHKTELQRVKAQIARDLKTPKVKPITGKIVGKVRRNYGKWKHIYQKHPKKPTKPKKP